MASFFFSQCGRNLRLGRNITFYNPSNIEIGNDVYIALGCWLLGAEKIVLKDEVMLGPYCVLSDSNHTMLNGSYRYGPPKPGKITVGMGTWVGAHSIILMDVVIGKGALIAANSVVNKAVKDFEVVGGVPAKKLSKNGD